MSAIGRAMDRVGAGVAARPWAALWLGLAALTVFRLGMLALNPLDLFVDEAQYWYWSTQPALGYFSKPPLIAWVIGLATAVGDHSPFWVRAAGPVAHAVTASLIALIAARLTAQPVVAALSGLAYATLPAVSLGSVFIATDTMMLPFFAGALLLWLRLSERASLPDAALLGLCVGLGVLAKYAMAYFVLCAAVLWLARRDWRIDRRSALIAGGLALALAMLNVGWNVANGGITFAHTAHNAGAAQGFPRFDSLGEFLGAQFGVMGPILFVAWLTTQLRRDDRAGALLRWFSLPVFLVVCLQALRVEANANWAAAMVVAATPAAVIALHAESRRLLRASFVLHGLVAVLLPLSMLLPETLVRPSGRPVYARVMGQAELAREIGDMARAAGAGTILSDDRALLAAMLHELRDEGFAIRAPRRDGPPRNHFEMAIPLEAEPDGVILKVSRNRAPNPPEGFGRVEVVRNWSPAQPFMKTAPLWAYRFTFE